MEWITRLGSNMPHLWGYDHRENFFQMSGTVRFDHVIDTLATSPDQTVVLHSNSVTWLLSDFKKWVFEISILVGLRKGNRADRYLTIVSEDIIQPFDVVRDPGIYSMLI